MSALVSAVVVVGCGSQSAGYRILEDLERTGLVTKESDGPRPAMREAQADERWALPAEGLLGLPALFEAADHLNPRIGAARARIGIAGGRAWQAGLYPNPTFGLESENVNLSGGAFGVSETTASIAQPIVISGRLDAGVAAGEAEVEVERREFERIRRAIHGQVLRTVTEISYARQSIALHERLIELAQRTLDIAESRFEARAAPESEAIRARVEANALGIAIERLRGDLLAGSERLDTLLGGNHVEIERVGEAVLDDALATELPELDTLRENVRETHPAILAARSAIEAAEHRVDLERSRKYADITGRLGVGIDHADDNPFVEAGVGIPLTIFDQNQGNVLAARFGVVRAKSEEEAISSELTGSLAEAYRRWESASSRLAVFGEQVLAGAERAYEQAGAGYEAGKLPFLDLLDAQRTLIEVNIALIELKRAVSLTLAEILEILGEHPSKEHE